ncbi:MAG: hypothetical protein JW787_03215 [Sedimentisphaerales bacterium]|nr:hypothetical protein [Sedimentisphaerales bacterium]
MKEIDKSKFTEHFLNVNQTIKDNFDRWVIRTGMLYDSRYCWWGRKAGRKHPHEGLDLGYYRNAKNQIIELNKTINVPTIYAGTVVGIFDDFLGQSIFFKHEIFDLENGQLCTVLGHLSPAANIRPGKTAGDGEIAGQVASAEKSSASPHIHITIGWVKGAITTDLLDWSNIGSQKVMKLINPLDVFVPTEYRIVRK